MLKIVYSPPSSAFENMQVDKNFLENLKNPILHLYNWAYPSITYGYFIEIEKYINLKNLRDMKIDIARRPTGGGIVFHMWNMAFAFLLPSNHKYFFNNTIQNYKFVNQIVVNALKKSLKKNFSFYEDMQKTPFCMSACSKYDVLIEDKKVIGAAQRKKKGGYLHQGIISLSMPRKEILQKLLLSHNYINKILLNSFFIQKSEEEIQSNLIQSFKEVL